MKNIFTTLNLILKNKQIKSLVVAFICLLPVLAIGQVGEKQSGNASPVVAQKNGAVQAEQGNASEGNKPKKLWSINPFDHQVFVENRGQFNNVLKSNAPVLFYAMVGGAKLYFTPKGVVYEYDAKVVDKEATEIEEERERENKEKGKKHRRLGDPDEMRYKTIPHFVSAEWQGANPKVTLSAEGELPNYYTYGVDESRTIKANLFKKITYTNIYPGIDLVYTFNENRDQIKYAVIVHPGADVSQLKFKYSGDAQTHVDEKGNIVTSGTELQNHNLTEFAPVSYYQDGGNVKVNYALQNGVESFTVNGGYDKSRTLIIDPAINPGFTGSYDVPYDLDYDNAGNIWAYGAYSPHQLSMINPAGSVVWTFNTSTVTIHPPGGKPAQGFDEDDYGGFCVDKVGKLGYISEGFNPYGAGMIKVNSSGSLVSQFNGSGSMLEMWRMQYNICTGKILVGGGGTNNPSGQVAEVNTTFSSLTSYDIYAKTTGNASTGKDIDRMCIDPTGSPAYMDYVSSATQVTAAGYPKANKFNTLLSLNIPIPGSGVATRVVDPSGQALLELGSNYYIGPGIDPNGSQSVTTCGFNGMAASPGWLYDWDGYTLRKLNKGTLATSGTVAISAYNTNKTNGYNYANAGGGRNFQETDVYYGGLAADACDNVYVGNVVKATNTPEVVVYNSALVLQAGSTISPLPSYPYAVVLGVNDSIIYVCGGPCSSSPYGTTGSGFVEAWANNIKTVTTSANAVNTTCGLNNGKDSASLKLCGAVQAGVTYSWSPGGQTTQVVTGLAPGTYTVTMEIGCGNYYQAVATVGGSSPIPPSGVTANANTPLCVGSTLNLSGGATGATTWSWTGPNSFTSSSQNPSISNVTAANAGTYNLVASNSCGVASVVPVTVVVNPNPSVSIAGAPSVTICQGQSTLLSASPSGLSSYTWTASPATGNLNNTTYDTTTASPTVTTVYTVIATDGNGCSNAAAPATITVNVNPSPTVSVSSSVPSDSICSGGSITLTSSVTPGGGTYSWNTTPAQTTSAVTVSPLTTTTYVVTYTTAAGCSTGSKAADTTVVTVTPTPTLTVGPSSSLTICPGDSAHIYVSGAGTYSWNTGATTDSIWVKPSSNSTYTVNGSNGKCPAAAAATVTVNVGVLTVGIKSSGGTTVCSGVPDTLTEFGGATSITWSTGATTNPIIVTPTHDTTFYVNGSSGLGCSASDTIKLKVNVTPTVVSVSVNDSSGTVCPGDTTQAFVKDSGVGPYIYSWSTTPVQTHDTAYGLGAGTYTVTVTSANGCAALTTNTVTITTKNIVVTATASGGGNICTGGSGSTLTATGANNYVWSPGVGLTPTTSSTTTANPDSTVTYTVTGTTTGKCLATATVTVTVNPTPTLTLNLKNKDTAVCTGGSINISVGGAGAGGKYTWSPNSSLTPTSGPTVVATPTATTTYVVTGTTAAGCSANDTIVVKVVATPTTIVTVTGGNDTVCTGKSITLTANGGGGATYSWSPGGSTNASVTVTNVTSASTYTVTTTNAGCSVKNTQDINVFPGLVINMLPTTNGCSGRPVDIGATVSGGNPLPGYTYVWSPDVGGTMTGPGPYSVLSSNQTYTCTVTDGCKATATGTTQVIVTPTPVAGFVPMPADSVLAGGYLSFKNTSTGGSTYYWTFGNGSTSDSAFPYEQFLIPGNYIVTQWVVSAAGCRDSISDTILVKQWIFIPNVFTPNNDGINDVFHVTMAGAKSYHIEIFNRWGEQVFNANDPNIDWNGRSPAGVRESDGIYYYQIIATDYTGKNYNLDGYVQIIGSAGQ